MDRKGYKIVRLSAYLGERPAGHCYLVEYLDLDTLKFSVSIFHLLCRYGEGVFFKYNSSSKELRFKKYGSWKRVFKLYKVK